MNIAVAAPGDVAVGLIVDGVIDQSAAEVLDSSGAVLETSPAASDVRMDAAMRWSGSAWTMRAVHVQSKAAR